MQSIEITRRCQVCDSCHDAGAERCNDSTHERLCQALLKLVSLIATSQSLKVRHGAVRHTRLADADPDDCEPDHQ
jgi:hypothetical protein